MTQDGMERLIEAARDYNQPPETPRDEMWAGIRAELDEERPSDDLARRRAARAWLHRSTPWAVGLAAAATLAVGFGLGRLTRTPGPTTGPVATAPATAAEGPSTTVRLAAAEHMGDAEALLTLFRSAAESDDRAATADWARDLLSTTRLLLDSRVAEDPEMASLLEDLELVLVQIVNASGDEDRELIEEGIQQQELLTKLRIAAAPADISL